MLLAAAEGNPFLLLELARSPDHAAHPHPLGAALTTRLGRLEGGSRAAVDLLAVAATSMPAEYLRSATQALSGEALSVASLKARRWLRSTGDRSQRVSLYHNHLRSHAAATLDAPRRTACHAAWWTVLDAAQASPAVRFPHAVGIGDREAAGRLALDAADDAHARRAHSTAADWLGRALEHLPSENTQGLHLRRAQALRDAGRTTEAAAAFLEARHQPGASDSLELQAAEAVMTAGDTERGRDLVHAVLARAGSTARPGAIWKTARLLAGVLRLILGRTQLAPTEPDPGRALSADASWTLARGLAYIDPVDALDHALQSLWPALDTGDPDRASRVLAFLGGGVFFHLGPLRGRAESMLAQAETLAAGEDDALGTVRCWQAMTHTGKGDWEAGLALATEALERLGEAPQRHWERTAAETTRLWFLWHQGQFARLGAEATPLFGAARQRGDRLGQVIFGQYLAYADLAAARLDGSEARSRWILDHWLPHRFTVQSTMARHHLCELAVRRGDSAGAERLLTAETPAFRRHGGRSAVITRIRHDHLRAVIALHRGDRRTAAATAASLSKEARLDGPALGAAIRLALSDANPEPVIADLRAAGKLAAAEAVALQAGDPAAPDRLAALGVAEPAHWARAMHPITVGLGAG